MLTYSLFSGKVTVWLSLKPSNQFSFRHLESMLLAILTGAFIAFTVSASAGLGGSLILVPTLLLFMGAKEGIALAAMLLASNNVLKVIAYRRTIPLKATIGVVALTMIGAWIGARFLVLAPESWVHAAVIASLGLTLIAEKANWIKIQKGSMPILSVLAGATSGFSGTSGPLKGSALRCLRLERQLLVGAASLVSLAGDLTKTATFLHASLLSQQALILWFSAIPLMPLATLLGRQINRRLGERAYAGLFWTVMTGYTVRLLWS